MPALSVKKRSQRGENHASEPFWPAALASDSAIGGQVFARPHNAPVIRISSKYLLAMTFFSSSLRSGLCERLGDKLFGVFFLCVLSDDLLLDVGRDYFIMAECHRVTAASAGNTFELAVVLRNFR